MPSNFVTLPAIEIRPRRSMTLFAILAIAMVIGSYIFILCLAAACVYLPYLLLSSGSAGFQILLLFLFGIAIAAAMLWSLLPRFDKFEAPGLLLERSAHPRLFSELDAIAAALNEPLPREVYLIGDVNAFVADRGGLMGIGSRRVMGIGLPLLSTLTVSQFRAVLAHEFAHYYGGDTSLGPWVYKTKMAMIRVFQSIGSVGKLARFAILGVMYLVVATILKWYFMLFLRAINFVSRRQEYRADELACLIGGRQSLIDGLRSIHRATVSWPAFWKTEISPVLNEGSLPAIGDGFSRFLTAPQISAQIEKTLEARLREEKTTPYDTHPPLRDRVAAAERVSAPNERDRQPDTRSAISLLENLQATEIQFVENRIPDLRSRLHYVSWNEVAARITIPGWQFFTRGYIAALQGVTAATIPDQIPRLREIGSRIRDPKGSLLTPEQRTERAGQLFASALCLALLKAGWDLNAQPGIFDLQRGDQQLNPFLILHELMNGKLAPSAWVTRCRELGISDLPLGPDPAAPTSAPSVEQPQLFPAEPARNS